MRFPVAAALVIAEIGVAACSAPHRTLAIVPTLPACVPATAVNTVRVTALGDFAALPGLTASASAMQNATLSLPRETRVVDVQGFGPLGLAAFGRTAPLVLDSISDGAIGLAYGPPDGICATAQLNVARAAHHATLLPSGAVLVSGGYNSDGPVTLLELYLPDGSGGGATKALFQPINGVTLDPNAVLGHAVAVLPDGGVLISGGVGVDVNAPNGENGIAYQGAVRLRADGSPGNKLGVLPAGSRAEHSATTLADGRVLLAGGCAELMEGSCVAKRVLGSTLLYDPATDSFTAAPPLMHPRFGHRAVLRGDGTVLLVGGLGEGGAVVPAEVIDPVESRGFDAGPSTGAAVGLLTGAALVAGAPASRSGHVGLWLSATEDELTLADVPSDGTGAPLLAALDDGGVLIVAPPSLPSQAFVFDGRQTVTPLPAPLPFDPGSLTRLADGTVLLAGGRPGAATKNAAIYFRSPVSPFASLPPLTLDAPSDPYLPRRPDRASAAAGQLRVTAMAPPGSDGRPTEFALVAGMQVADFDFDLLAGRRGATTAALLAGWQSDAAFVFVALAVHEPVALWTMSVSRPGEAMARPVSTCIGAVLSDGELPDGALAHLHLAWRNGTLTLTSGRPLLSCRPPAPLLRGQVGVGSVDGTAVFGNLSLSR